MPYKKIEDLPEAVKDNLPKGGQEIYQAAYNNAWEYYKDPENRQGDASREETAHRVAWDAVKQEYEKNDNGDWVKR